MLALYKIEYVFVIKFNELFPIVGLLGLLLPFDNFELKTKCDFSKNWELFLVDKKFLNSTNIF